MNPPLVAILCGGKGARFSADVKNALSAGESKIPSDLLLNLEVIPKFLAPVGPMPILAHKVHSLTAAGTRDYVLVTNSELGPKIDAALRGCLPSRCACNLSYAEQGETILNHLLRIIGESGRELLVSCGDTLVESDYPRLLTDHRTSGATVTRALLREDRRSFCGDALFDPRILRESWLLEYRELPDGRLSSYLRMLDAHAAEWIEVDRAFNVNDLKTYRAVLEAAAVGDLMFLPALARVVNLETLAEQSITVDRTRVDAGERCMERNRGKERNPQ